MIDRYREVVMVKDQSQIDVQADLALMHIILCWQGSVWCARISVMRLSRHRQSLLIWELR